VDLLGRGRGDKRISKAQLVDQVLDVLAPKA
jgi:hypothetical protein